MEETENPPSDVDPLLPTGARRSPSPRPTGLARVACSDRFSACVHAEAALPAARAERHLQALEQALSRLVGALGLPAPLSDHPLGPTAGLDVYLLSGEHAPASGVDVRADPRRMRGDRTSAHCRIAARGRRPDRLATLCVAEALLIGLNAAASSDLRRAVASYLWRLVGQPTPADLEEVDDLQSNPQLSLVGRDRHAASGASSLLVEHLDRSLRVGRPGALPVALFPIARGVTEPGSLQWNNEPDAMDVLRRAFDGSTRSLSDFLLGFAVERAFVGSRDDGTRHPEQGWLGNAGRIRFDWVLEASSLPRRVASRRPLEPLGSAYLWLDLDRVSLGSTIALRTRWEAPVSFRWTVVAVDESGRELKRYDLPFVAGATSAERTLVDHDGAVALLVVGLNLGGVDLAHPFDPDHEPWEPHGFTVYFAEI